MSRHEQLSISELTLTVAERNYAGDYTRVFGTSVPTGAGYAVTCVFANTSNGKLYQNKGTTSAAIFYCVSEETVNISTATIATTGNTDGYLVVAETGVLSSIDFSGVDALAANDTDYITFSVTNLGQAGGGSAAMLAASAANTTKVTGGTALAANTKRSLTVHGTAGNLVVTKGDRLLIRAAASGTLAGTVTYPVYCLRFNITV